MLQGDPVLLKEVQPVTELGHGTNVSRLGARQRRGVYFKLSGLTQVSGINIAVVSSGGSARWARRRLMGLFRPS